MNITQNDFNLSKQTIYIDDPMYKVTDSQGNLTTYKNSDALAQAFKLWLVSGQGEKVRSNTSGPLVPHLGKAITSERAEKIKKSILNGVSTDFNPPMTITELKVLMDQPKNRWLIFCQGYSKSLELGINTYVVVNNSNS
jgi:hypothetical protein